MEAGRGVGFVWPSMNFSPLAAALLAAVTLTAEGALLAQARVAVARFEHLVVPVAAPRGEAFFERVTPLIEDLVRQLDVRSATRRSEARTELARLDWRYLRVFEAKAKSGSAERRRALAFVVQRLLDRRYNGE